MNTNKLISMTGTTLTRWQCVLISVLGISLALCMRYLLRDFQNDDYRGYFGPWVDFIRMHGGYRALAFPFANYTPPYQYLLVLFSSLFPSLHSLYLIKLISVIFDFLAAFLVYRIVRVQYPHGNIPLFASLTFLFLPTVVINSAYWGQADVIYTTPLLACLYLFLKDRPTLAMIAFGLAVSIKLQAIFLAPVLAILLVNNRTTLASFFLIPATYLCTILPAWLIGRPMPDLLMIYLVQGKTYHKLTMNAPNLYTWIPNKLYELIVPAGLLVTTGVAIGLIAFTYKRRAAMTPHTLVALATFSVMAMPFFLPKMHDRYFYPADVFSLLMGFYFPKCFPIPLLMQFVSLFAYCPFLFGAAPVPLKILAVVLFVTLLAVARHLEKALRPCPLTASERTI